LLAGLLYRGYFAANWRLGPVLPLLLLPALAPRREDGSFDLWGALVSAVAAVQATAAAAAWAGLEPGAGGLAVAGVVAVTLVHGVRVAGAPGEPPTYAAPAGRRLAESVPLGTWPYAPESTPRDLVLDVWERVP